MKRRRDALPKEEEPAESPFKPLDIRRLREIRKWFEGNRRDAPTVEELQEFVAWISQDIEFALARHQPTRELLAYLNAARAELHRSGQPA